MPWWTVIWTDGAWEKIEQRGLDHDEIESTVRYPAARIRSRSTGRPIALGRTAAGERIAVVYEAVDRDSVLIITAYRIEG